MNWVADQAEFMRAGGQTVSEWNEDQASRYSKHILEEAEESYLDWQVEGSEEKAVDGAIDCIVVCIGFLLSLGIDPDKAWAAVHAANMRKVIDGKVYRRPDGQIGKPPGWYGPEDELRHLVEAAQVRADKGESV